MSNISERLVEELKHKGVTTQSLGELGVVLEKVNATYGQMNRHPDSAALASVAKAGVDAVYVFTGMRVGTPTEPETLAVQLVGNSNKEEPSTITSSKKTSGFIKFMTVVFVVAALLALLLIWGNLNYDSERDDMRRRIELCEKDLADPLISIESKRTIVAPVCERYRAEYDARYRR